MLCQGFLPGNVGKSCSELFFLLYTLYDAKCQKPFFGEIQTNLKHSCIMREGRIKRRISVRKTPRFDNPSLVCYSNARISARILQRYNQTNTYKSCARDKPDDRTATSQRERCQSLYDRFIPVPRLVFLRLFFWEYRKMRCIIILEEYFDVKTYWGWFRLDRGAYEDYLAGKLWITWVPGNRRQQMSTVQAAMSRSRIASAVTSGGRGAAA